MEHLYTEPGERREAIQRDRNRAIQIGLSLLQRHAWLQTRKRLIAEITQKHFVGIDLQRQQQRRVVIEETEALRHDPDDFARTTIEEDLPSDDVGIAAELCLPESVTRDDGVRISRRCVRARERTAEHGLNLQDSKNIFRDVECRDFI